MFNKASITAQLVRGALALAAVAGAVLLANDAWVVVPLLLLAIVLMGGCPMCWLSEFMQALADCRARKVGHADRAAHPGR